MKKTNPSPRRAAFTLVELLVVIGVIALLISILLPTLNKARQSAYSLKCLSNLRQLGIATHMYVNAYRGALPYPTTLLPGDTSGSQSTLWFNALDPFLQSIGTNARQGVAGQREYKNWKQCVVYETFDGKEVQDNGFQDPTKGFARTYKMNTHLRRIPVGPAFQASQARITDVRQSSQFVYLGDGIAQDYFGAIPNVFENGQFSFEVNDPVEASPALRHLGGANILFVDGHAENVKLRSFKKPLQAPVHYVVVDTWYSEFLDAAGNPTFPKNNAQERSTMEQLGYQRNPNMPLIWSQLGKLYRP